MYDISAQIIHHGNIDDVRNGVLMTIGISRQTATITLWSTQRFDSVSPSSIIEKALEIARKEIKVRRPIGIETIFLTEFDSAGRFNTIKQTKNGKYTWLTHVRSDSGITGFKKLYGEIVDNLYGVAQRELSKVGLSIEIIKQENDAEWLRVSELS